MCKCDRCKGRSRAQTEAHDWQVASPRGHGWKTAITFLICEYVTVDEKLEDMHVKTRSVPHSGPLQPTAVRLQELNPTPLTGRGGGRNI